MLAPVIFAALPTHLVQPKHFIMKWSGVAAKNHTEIGRSFPGAFESEKASVLQCFGQPFVKRLQREQR